MLTLIHSTEWLWRLINFYLLTHLLMYVRMYLVGCVWCSVATTAQKRCSTRRSCTRSCWAATIRTFDRSNATRTRFVSASPSRSSKSSASTRTPDSWPSRPGSPWLVFEIFHRHPSKKIRHAFCVLSKPPLLRHAFVTYLATPRKIVTVMPLLFKNSRYFIFVWHWPYSNRCNAGQRTND